MPRIDKKYIKDPGALVHKIDIQRKTLSKPVKGIVEEIFVENAQPVEFGQPLFKIKKS